MVDRIEQTVRQDPQIIAERLRLANLAQAEAQRMRGTALPAYQAAGLSPTFTQAGTLATQGVGAYSPFLASATGGLEQAAGALGTGVSAMQQGLGALERFPAAYSAMPSAAGAADFAQQQVQQALAAGDVSTRQAQQALMQAGFSPGAAQAQSELAAQQARLGQMPGAVQQGLTGAMAPAQALTAFGQIGMGETGIAQQQAQEAIERGRGIAGLAAGQSLAAGQMFDPSMAAGFMDPFQRDVIEAQQQEMQRLADIQRQGIAAQAVGAGAFGGSREAVQQAELTRNLMDQQSRIAAELMSQGFTQSQAQAQAAFEAAQQRQLAGAGQAGQIGLSAEQLAAQTGLAGGQLGLAGTQQAAANAAQLAQLGLSAEQIAAQTGLSVEQARQAASQATGQLGLAQSQLGQQAALSSGQLGQQMAQLGLEGGRTTLSQADLMRQIGLSTGQLAGQEAEIARNLGLGIGSLGTEMGQLSMSQAQLGALQSSLLGQDVQRLAALSEIEREQQQRVLDAQRMSGMQDYLRPFQEIGLQADIYSGIPVGQSLIQATASPQPSTAQQVIGTGISALTGLAGAQQSGLF